MDRWMDDLSPCKLFEGIEQKDMPVLLDCLQARRVCYDKDSYVLRAGDSPDELGVVLKGAVTIAKEDYWGNRSIIQRLGPGGVFAESFAAARAKSLPVSVIAVERSELLFLHCDSILSVCMHSCPFHTQLIFNMVQLLAQKNIALTQKIEHITMRSTRDKLLSYLSGEAIRQGSDRFTIPYNRQELADYLCVERSAMSWALSGLKREGRIDYHKSDFWLTQGPQAL